MSKNVKLRAGTPDDDTREYLPESIKGSDITINENGNNSIPYNPRLQEIHTTLRGVEGTYYLYVPETYDPSKKVPLVIGNHGGLMTGWGHSTYTSWVLVAEKYGFICAFPDAHANRAWALESPKYGKFGLKEMMDQLLEEPAIEENPDVNFILGIIESLEEQFSIDKGRIFMQGMSMGNMFTHLFCRYHGDLLAGAAGASGPGSIRLCFDQEGNIINHAGPLAIWQTRAEHNGYGSRSYEEDAIIDKYNRFYWMEINECDPIPEIKIDGEDNYAFYKGRKAPLVFCDVKNRDHGQTLDEAFLYWEYLFSGIRRREDGTIEHSASTLSQKGDAFNIAFTPGVKKYWFNNALHEMNTAPVKWQKNKYHGQGGNTVLRGEYICVPASVLAETVGATYVTADDGLTGLITLQDGRELQIARGVIGCMIDDTLRSMYCECLLREGELLISAEWFYRYVMQKTASVCNEVVYITDHHAELSYFMADLLKDLLKDEALPKDYKHIPDTDW